jgi:NADP-dependent 3-hydroxy acid dehydrogenase YdfG
VTSSDVGDTKGPQGGAGRADPHPRQRGHRGGRRCAGLYGFAGEAVYCASKFAQVGFAQALDRELRPKGIKVGVICPGGVKTEFALGKGRTAESVAQSAMLAPEDVAAAVVLACTQAPGSRIIEIQMRPMGEPLA